MLTTVREARGDDWPIIQNVITQQETIPYAPGMSEADARRMWLLPAPARVVVAGNDQVLGTANMYANRGAPGNHVAACRRRR